MTAPHDFDELIETIPCRYGVMAYFKSDQVIGASLREYGEWAQREIEFLLRLLQKGDTVLDVGAYIGTHTLAFARQVGKTGAVVAIEPNPCSFKVLTLNVAANRLTNVRMEQAAVSNREGMLHLPDSCLELPANPGSVSLLSEEAGEAVDDSSGLARVPVKCLDQFELSACALIKVDVEGMETLALEGAQKLLQKHRPLVYAECLSVANGAAMQAFMTAREYTGFLHCELAYNPANFRGNAHDIFGTAREANVIFVPNEKLHEFNKRVGRHFELIPLDTVDDLVLGMLRKPQYKQDVLDRTQAAAVVGNDFWLNLPERRYFERELAERTALVQRLENETAALRHQVSERDTLVVQTRQEQETLRQAIAGHQASIQQLQAELAQRGQLAAELQGLVQGREEFIAFLRAETAEKSASLERLRGELEQKEGALSQVQQALAGQEAAAGSLRAELQQREETLKQVHDALAQQESLAAGLRADLDQNREALKQARAELRDRKQHIAALSDRLEAAEARSADLAWQLGRREQDNAALAAQVEQMAKSNELAERRLQARETQVKGLEASLQNEQGRNEWLAASLQQHQAKEQEFSSKLWEIYGSTAWKLVRRMWQVRLFLFPPGSRRERLGRLGMRALQVLRREGLGAFVRAAFRKLRRQPQQPPSIPQSVKVWEQVLSQPMLEKPAGSSVPVENGALIAVGKTRCVIERFDSDQETLTISGWLFYEGIKVASAEAIIESDRPSVRRVSPLAYGRERVDVFGNFKGSPQALYCGFFGSAKLFYRKQFITLSYTLENGTRVFIEFSKPFTGYTRFRKTLRTVFNIPIVTVKLLLGESLRNIRKDIRLGGVKFAIQRLRHNLSKEARQPSSLDLSYCASLFREGPQKPHKLQEEIDIIIPVFNGFDYLHRLLTSIFDNTDSPYRLIIVDDNSTDSKIRPYLDNVNRTRSNVRVIFNPVNEGFVKTVNLASQYVRNHFVILNTDVEVPKGWLSRLMKPVVYGERVASTTPFTNAGTICSFPTPNVDNAIFGNLDLETIDSVFRQIDPASAEIELPTGVGFCMGVNFHTWKKIGPFDENNFGRGYGEENDWCMRARKAGYRNLLAANLFVWHKHGGSFASSEKQELAKRNLERLATLHPDYQPLVNQFIQADPLESLRKFAAVILAARASTEAPIFIVDHELGGGANAYRNQFSRKRLEKGQVIFLLTHDNSWHSLKLKVMNRDREYLFKLTDASELLRLQGKIEIGEIFYNNAVGFEDPLKIVQALVLLKETFHAKLSVAVHDYFLICPSYTLLDYAGHFCGPSTDFSVCQACLPKNPYRPLKSPTDIRVWRKDWSRLLSQADEVICFSEDSRRNLEKVYNISKGKIAIQPHEPLVKFSKKPRLDFRKPLCVGVIGAINYAKGAQMVADIASIFTEDYPEYKIKVLGMLNGAPDLPSLMVTGLYKREELPSLIEAHNINICFFPSIWPETFSFVIQEMIALELPIVCFDIGAPAERIKKYRLGRVVSEIDAQLAVEQIVDFYLTLKDVEERTNKSSF